MILRSKELQKKYEKELEKWKDKCYLCEINKENYLKEFFKVNDFPYDELANEHYIYGNTDHNNKILKTKFSDVDIIFQNKEKNCSIKEDPHLHLITFREDISKELIRDFIEYTKVNNILIYLDKKYTYFIKKNDN